VSRQVETVRRWFGGESGFGMSVQGKAGWKGGSLREKKKTCEMEGRKKRQWEVGS